MIQIERVKEEKMETKDWKPKLSAKALVIGHDPRLQKSDCIAEYVFFADYYFKDEFKNKSEKRKADLAKSTFKQIIDITNGKIKAEEIYLTNLCNSALPHAPERKTVLITESNAKEGIEHIKQILKENPTIKYIFPMSSQVNYLLQKFGFYNSNSEFIENSAPKKGISNYEPQKQRTFLKICGNKYKVSNGNQVIIPILHSKCYNQLKKRFIAYFECYEQIKEYFN